MSNPVALAGVAHLYQGYEPKLLTAADLAALPSRRREVLVLRYWLGLTEAEIAAVLGISMGTVQSTAARGLAALASKLGEQS